MWNWLIWKCDDVRMWRLFGGAFIYVSYMTMW